MPLAFKPEPSWDGLISGGDRLFENLGSSFKVQSTQLMYPEDDELEMTLPTPLSSSVQSRSDSHSSQLAAVISATSASNFPRKRKAEVLLNTDRKQTGRKRRNATEGTGAVVVAATAGPSSRKV